MTQIKLWLINQMNAFDDYNETLQQSKLFYHSIVNIQIQTAKRIKTREGSYIKTPIIFDKNKVLLRWCCTIFRSHKISLFPGNTFCFVRKSFRHDIPYISAECGIWRNMSIGMLFP